MVRQTVRTYAPASVVLLIGSLLAGFAGGWAAAALALLTGAGGAAAVRLGVRGSAARAKDAHSANAAPPDTRRPAVAGTRIASGENNIILFPKQDPVPVSQTSNASEGELEASRQQPEQLGKWLTELATIARHLETAADTMTGNAAEVETRAEQIAASSLEMAAALGGQMEENREALAQSEQVRGKFSETMISITDSQTSLAQWEQQTLRGMTDIRQLIDGMARIGEASTDTETRYEQFSASLSTVGKAMKEIRDIADQTQLLALNAAIEAAHAGEYGAGFRIVAQEVKSLSDRSKKLSTRLAETIQGLLRQSEQTSAMLRKQTSAIRDNTERSSRVSELLSGMSSAMSEAAAGSERVQADTGQLEALYRVLHQRMVALTETAGAAARRIEDSAEASQIQLISMMELTASIDVLKQLSEQITNGLVQMDIDPRSMKWVRAYQI